MGVPRVLKLLWAGGEERLHGSSGITDRAALCLELGTGLGDQAGDRRVGPFGPRPLGGLNTDKPPGEHGLALEQGVDGA
eukprot:10955530-Alexandrium_andersonii.AAC.1